MTPLPSDVTDATGISSNAEDLPVLKHDQKLDLKSLRYETENLFLTMIITFNVVILAALLAIILWCPRSRSSPH